MEILDPFWDPFLDPLWNHYLPFFPCIPLGGAKMSDFGGPKKGPKMGPTWPTLNQYLKSLFLGNLAISPNKSGGNRVKKGSKRGHFGPFLAQKGVKKGSGDPPDPKNVIF